MSTPSPSYPELAAARSRVAQLDVEIEQLRSSLEARLVERDQCRNVLTRYKYPILTLPAEITSEIFIQFLPTHLKFTPLIGPYSPAFLLQICHQWRDIALGTPALWSSIQVDFYDRRMSLHNQKLERLELWLRRSGNCPLSIQISDAPLDTETASIPSTKFVEAIMRQALRLQHVEIEVPYEGLRGLTGSMPMLRSVLVGPSDTMPPDTTPSQTAVPVFMLAPNLKKVVLSTIFNPFTITLPWSQLTTLTAELYIPQAIYVLCQTTALETCKLTIYGYDDPGTAHPVASPLHLRSLSLYWGDGRPDDSLVALVNALTLPALDSLVVSEYLLGPDPVAAVSRLRPQGYPRSMEIFDARLSPEVYQQAFPDAVLNVESLEDD
ncbi:hypothetical protein FB45DRAFT_842915 [Roridomyces roridus]|uniref:F-box domain-containing protein n=1 Tax=Roridomyces roridus TaxID=1738132 RepID=A0AAD7FAW3_9AGAR|nr:hypothetical protein FB45DRAFT_842915 [Roridomyces roridus]